jgi:hypothetical protein
MYGIAFVWFCFEREYVKSLSTEKPDDNVYCSSDFVFCSAIYYGTDISVFVIVIIIIVINIWG